MNNRNSPKKAALEAGAAGAGAGAVAAAAIKYSDSVVQFVAGEPATTSGEVSNEPPLQPDEQHPITTSASALVNSDPAAPSAQTLPFYPEATADAPLEAQELSEADTEEIVEGITHPEEDEVDVIDAVTIDTEDDLRPEYSLTAQEEPPSIEAEQDDFSSPAMFEPAEIDDDFTDPDVCEADGNSDDMYFDEFGEGCI